MPSPRTLDYAHRPAISPPRWDYRIVAALFALVGAAFNLTLVALVVREWHRASWAYHDLMQNPRAYGREIDPATIATLRQPIGLWISNGALIVAAAFGLLLAVDLLIACVLMHRQQERANYRLWLYGRLKIAGAAATAIACIWSGAEEHAFWVAASRHWPVGSSAVPVLPGAILFLCAWLPAWWVRRGGR